VSFTAAPSGVSAGWYRLAVGCYIVIIIGWFAGIVSSFRNAIYAFANKAEARIIEAAQGVFFTTPQEVSLSMSATKYQVLWKKLQNDFVFSFVLC